MANAAEFVLRLIDKASAPAARIAGAMKMVDKAIKPLKNNAAFSALDKAGTKLWEAGKQAAFLSAAVGGLGVAALGAATIKTAIFAENTQLAFERLTGSAQKGRAAFANVTSLVSELGLGLHDTAESFKELLAQQFSIGEADEIVRMVSDLRVIGVEGEKAQRVLMALTQIRAKGKVQQEELLQLAEAGISLKLVMEELQKATGKSRDELASMQQAGKLGADVGLEAIKAAVKQKLHIDKFGDAGRRFADETLAGMLGRVRAAGELLLLQIAEAARPAIMALKPVVGEIQEFIKGLEPEGFAEFAILVADAIKGAWPIVKNFLVGFGEGAMQLAEQLRTTFGGASGFDMRELGRNFAGFLGLLIDLTGIAIKVIGFLGTPIGKVVAGFGLFVLAATQVLGVLVPLATAIAALGLAAAIPIATVLGLVLGLAAAGTALYVFWDDIVAFFSSLSGRIVSLGDGVVSSIMGVFKAGWSAISEFFGGLPDKMLQFGIDMVKGLIQGLFMGGWVEAIVGLVTSGYEAAKKALGIASPSKEFEWLGMQSAAGFMKGINDSAIAVQSASSQAIAQPALQGVAAPAASSAPSISAPVTIVIDGSKSPTETAAAVEAQLETGFARILERLTAPSPAAA